LCQYTNNFAYSNLRVTPAWGGATAQVTITNTGYMNGAEVAQLYLTDPADGDHSPLVPDRAADPGQRQSSPWSANPKLGGRAPSFASGRCLHH
jgi:hypothetical protein